MAYLNPFQERRRQNIKDLHDLIKKKMAENGGFTSRLIITALAAHDIGLSKKKTEEYLQVLEALEHITVEGAQIRKFEKKRKTKNEKT